MAADRHRQIEDAILLRARETHTYFGFEELRADAQLFASWARNHERTVVPAEPDTVRSFLKSQISSGEERDAVARMFANIMRLHSLASDLPEGWRDAMQSMANESLAEIILDPQAARDARLSHRIPFCFEAMLSMDADNTQDVRDLALLGVAVDTGASRSRLVAVRWEEVSWHVSGVGALQAASHLQEPIALCRRTVAALRAWARESGADSGKIFRRLHRASSQDDQIWTLGASLTPQSVPLIYRRLLEKARAIGLLGTIADNEFVALRRHINGHSTRGLYARRLLSEGRNDGEIMIAMGLKSRIQARRYRKAFAAC
ncbi:tyrosine-type recombinase/integrase [Sphingomonas crocodyli]|uniref:Tyr recombinase domain-containing protein n=1 Tax=Sphingomonas crocodyli TaxID=1979270 RepID=A0A437LY28_9SPHN|nr:tyrosine-type recombinase/integrase [Sphingomonas crocodyli]RVT90236.1 hypothetical protein EOD43_18245 [Sphingomonas crocodyli]